MTWNLESRTWNPYAMSNAGELRSIVGIDYPWRTSMLEIRDAEPAADGVALAARTCPASPDPDHGAPTVKFSGRVGPRPLDITPAK